jgi:hypothetical protein
MDNPIILRLTPGTQEFLMFQLTFGLFDCIIFDEEGELKPSFTEASFDVDFYDELRDRFIDPEDTVEINFTEFLVIYRMVDFVSKLMVSNKSEIVETFIEEELDGEPDYATFSDTYLAFSTSFFKQAKNTFEDQPEMLKLLENLTTWKRDT